MTLVPLSMRGAPPSPFCPLLLLLLLSTSLALRRSGLRLLLVEGTAAARAGGARVVEGMTGAAVVAVEEVEGVGVEVGGEDRSGGVGGGDGGGGGSGSGSGGGGGGGAGWGGAVQRIVVAALGASESAAPYTAGEPAAPGAGESALSGTALAEALHKFTVDSSAFRSFFRDCTTLTPLSRPVDVSLADPSRGPVLAHSSTVLPCPAVPSGSRSGLHLPSFSTNLVSGADLQDVWVDQFTQGGQQVTHYTCTRTGRHLAAFTRQPESSLYTLTTASTPVTASRQVFAATSRSLPPLPPGPTPTCDPCVEGRQRIAPHSSEFPPTEAPSQNLHMDVWGPARVRGQGNERYFLLVVDDYSRYTTVFPLRCKSEVTEVLIDWIRTANGQLSASFGSDLPVLCLHSERGGEFSSDLLQAFCRAEGIRRTFTLPASPQQNGIAERRIGMVMDVARTSMIHVAAPHFLWPFAV
ncbi:unnamed protein product [Closterium sp. NIES-64]|nr:unnamed protein product [Closterium sp. NIES-64]